MLGKTWEKMGEEDKMKFVEMPKLLPKKYKKKKDDEAFRPEIDM
jgi:hypothetical protein